MKPKHHSSLDDFLTRAQTRSALWSFPLLCINALNLGNYVAVCDYILLPLFSLVRLISRQNMRLGCTLGHSHWGGLANEFIICPLQQALQILTHLATMADTLGFIALFLVWSVFSEWTCLQPSCRHLIFRLCTIHKPFALQTTASMDSVYSGVHSNLSDSEQRSARLTQQLSQLE